MALFPRTATVGKSSRRVAFTGNFGSITAGYSVQQQGNNLVLFFGTPLLAGDYNGDGVVNAGDYVDLAASNRHRRHVAE